MSSSSSSHLPLQPTVKAQSQVTLLGGDFVIHCGNGQGGGVTNVTVPEANGNIFDPGAVPRWRLLKYFPSAFIPTPFLPSWAMYPPQSNYERLATDPEADILFPPRKTPLQRLRPWIRPLAFGLAVLLVLAVIVQFFGTTVQEVDIPFIPHQPSSSTKWNFTAMFPSNHSFAFHHDRKPSWLYSSPAGGPLTFRVAVISHTDEFDRRQAVRESVFLGVKEQDVKFEFRFIVGKPIGENATTTSARLEEENKTYGDLVLLDIPDMKPRLSEKRYAALKWAGTVSHDSYDYFMTIDSDTFVRFGALARRMPSFLNGRNVKPREQAALIGRMAEHVTYFVNTVPEGNGDSDLEDSYVKGPWFKYPAGIGYILSSFLVKTMLSTNPELAHHVHYPSDDVMIGSWIAALRLFPDKSVVFETPPVNSPNGTVHRVHPEPYLPDPIDTEILDDTEGWHDFIDRGGHDASFSWNSVCVHHVSADEMRAFRTIDVIKGEWEL